MENGANSPAWARLSCLADCSVSSFPLACFRLTGNRNRRIMINTHFFLFKEIPPFMKPLDQFKRTPPRRYDQAPPPPPEEKRTLEPAIRKRYF